MYIVYNVTSILLWKHLCSRRRPLHSILFADGCAICWYKSLVRRQHECVFQSAFFKRILKAVCKVKKFVSVKAKTFLFQRHHNYHKPCRNLTEVVQVVGGVGANFSCIRMSPLKNTAVIPVGEVRKSGMVLSKTLGMLLPLLTKSQLQWTE